MTPDLPPSSASQEDELTLRPPDCPSREQLERELLGPLEITPPEVSSSLGQFSVGDIMIVMVGVGVGLAGGSWMPTDVFAGVLGLATLLGLLLVSWHPPETRWGKLVWTSFVVAYFMAVLAAILRPPVR